MIRAKGYSHLGIRGDLHLLFVGDRLFEVVFFPEKVDEYFQRLAVTVNLPRHDATRRSSWRTRVKRYASFWEEERVMVYWVDERLAREFSEAFD